jgi:hypothetical protein
MVMAGFSPTPAEEMDGVQDEAPKQTTPAKIKETKENGKKVYVMPSADEDRVPANVTDSAAPAAEPLVVADKQEEFEPVMLKAYSKEKVDKKGNQYRGVLLIHSDNSEKWWNCYHPETIAALGGMKGQTVNAKLEMKGEYPLCHKIEVPNG